MAVSVGLAFSLADSRSDATLFNRSRIQVKYFGSGGRFDYLVFFATLRATNGHRVTFEVYLFYRGHFDLLQ